MGKEVIGVGPRSPLSECVKSSCTRYIYTDLVEEQEAQYELSEAVAMIETMLDEHGDPMGLSTLKNKLISMDNAFDERNWGYSNFSAFIRDIQSVEMFQEKGKTHWLGRIKKVIVKHSDQSTLQLASTDAYRTILRNMKWPFVPRNLIITLHESLHNTKPMEASDIKENLIQIVSPQHKRKLMAGSTSSDIRKGLNVLLKAQLFNVTVGENDEKYWQYKGNSSYLSEINKAMIERMQSGCCKEHLVFDLKLLQPLLYPKG
jgi:hypothetical protein